MKLALLAWIIVALYFILLGASCSKRVPVTTGTLQRQGDGWKFETDGKHTVIIARDDAALRDALEQLQCGICTAPDKIGDVYHVEKLGTQ